MYLSYPLSLTSQNLTPAQKDKPKQSRKGTKALKTKDKLHFPDE